MILRFKFMHNLWSMDSIFLIPFPEIKFDLQIAKLDMWYRYKDHNERFLPPFDSWKWFVMQMEVVTHGYVGQKFCQTDAATLDQKDLGNHQWGCSD